MKPEAIHRCAGFVGAALFLRAFGELSAITQQLVVLVVENDTWITPPFVQSAVVIASFIVGAAYLFRTRLHLVVHVATLGFFGFYALVGVARGITGWTPDYGVPVLRTPLGLRINSVIGGAVDLLISVVLAVCVVVVMRYERRKPIQRLESNAGISPPSSGRSTAVEHRLPGMSQP